MATPRAAHRGAYEVDRDRIIHSQTFRELQHKTQVQSLLGADGGAFRTRLNHVLEVAQIARSLARRIGATEPLAEAIALAHDLGHPPFGHAGERALRQALDQAGRSGWNANVHSLAVVDKIECSYIAFRGLNLTRATREGIARHSTPFDEPVSFGEFTATRWGGLECQIVDAADVLAYLSHDLDDALAGGYLGLEDVRGVSPILGELASLAETEWREAWHVWPDETRPHLVRRAVVARLVGRSIADLAESTASRLRALPQTSPTAIREADDRLVEPSAEYAHLTQALLSLLTTRYYRSEIVREADEAAVAVVSELLAALLDQTDLIPPQFHDEDPVIAAATYLASLNDHAAITLARTLAATQGPASPLAAAVAQTTASSVSPAGSSSGASRTAPT